MVVRMRHTRSHTRNRRSHHALKTAQFVACGKCGSQNLPHTVCSNCGSYKGRVVIDIAGKLEQKQLRKRGKHKEAKEVKEKSGKDLDPAELSKK